MWKNAACIAAEPEAVTLFLLNILTVFQNKSNISKERSKIRIV